ncbi:MAG: extracellular solute-binding protein [Deltaproteobacteria bacterium]|nr:extracellular solute-binding protein [Deltaproteobacteria bacterium]
MRRNFCIGLLFVVLVGFAPQAKSQGWKQEWEQTLAAAKKEGRVAVLGPRQVQARDVLVEFQNAYGIKVDYLGGSGRTISPRVLSERRAGRYLWDVYVGGTTTGLTSLAPGGALAPLAPTFILPTVKDPKNWRGSRHSFADRAGRLQMGFSLTRRSTIMVNPKMIKKGDLKSHKDLLDPKWSGKIVLDDPRKPGPGQATFLFFLLHPDLGPEFIRAFGKQKVTILRDYQQELNGLARGRYPILIGSSDATAEFKISQGVPIHIVDPRTIKEGSDAGTSNGATALVDKAPHPNAAKVFINWLLSKDAQTAYSKNMQYVSQRLDVPTDHVREWRVPPADAIGTWTEDALDKKDELMPLLREVYGR